MTGQRETVSDKERRFRLMLRLALMLRTCQFITLEQSWCCARAVVRWLCPCRGAVASSWDAVGKPCCRSLWIPAWYPHGSIGLGTGCQFSPKHWQLEPCPRKRAVLRSWQHVVLWLPSLSVRFLCWLFQHSIYSQSLLIV